ncbi:MAG: winged helix family transcriptional regulator [Alphaproteobacteria bacterium]|nr:winged helix family transcriptional regulator [Alphaproteobacteria bacterium]
MVSKSNMIDFVYGVGEDVNDTTLEVLISRLRKKVSAYGVQVNMVRGLGYYLKAE